MALYEIGADGALRRVAAVQVPDVGMVHDFAVTERHLVFLMPPLVYDGKRKEAGATFLDRACLAARARHARAGGRQGRTGTSARG